MKIKCGRNEFELTNDDVIMYNRTCYQLVTRTVGFGWNTSIPILAKSRANKLIASGELILFEQKDGLKYYKQIPS